MYTTTSTLEEIVEQNERMLDDLLGGKITLRKAKEILKDTRYYEVPKQIERRNHAIQAQTKSHFHRCASTYVKQYKNELAGIF